MEPTDSLNNLRAKIKEIEGIHPAEQRFLAAGRILEEGHDLKYYNIQEGSTVNLVKRSLGEPIRIDLMTLTGRCFAMIVYPRDTIRSLKEKLEEKEGTPVQYQVLVNSGRALDDSRTIGEYISHEFATIHLVVRMRGA
jgi:ubiquitin C